MTKFLFVAVAIFFSAPSFSQTAKKTLRSAPTKSVAKDTAKEAAEDLSPRHEEDAPVTPTTPAKESGEPSLGKQSVEATKKAEKAVQAAISNAGDHREENPFSLVAEYSPIDLIIPSKIGLALGYGDRSVTNELEYLSASVSAPFFITDIGGISDKRISFVRRSFGERNSFNFQYGLAYFDLEMHVGNRYIQSATNLPASIDAMSSKSLGFMVGIGNRWILPYGITLGADWISWSQPLVILKENSDLINYVTDQSAKKTLQDAFHISQYLPRITILKLGMGLTF